jgi:hypothetical protein
MHKDIDKKIVADHIKAVAEDKTKQLADHFINVRTLEKKILRHECFLQEEVAQFEKDLKYMAGKKEPQTQKYMAGMDDEYKKNFTKYIAQKNDRSNLEYAEKAIVEHEEFLSTLKSLGEEIGNQINEHKPE